MTLHRGGLNPATADDRPYAGQASGPGQSTGRDLDIGLT
jgi:hypothetical protein